MIMIRNRKHCDKCNKDFSLSNYNKHYASCSGVKIKKIRGIDYDPNARFKNPLYKSHPAWNKGLTKETSERVAQIVTTFKSRVASGDIVIIGRVPSDDTKLKISESMKKASQAQQSTPFQK